MGIRVKVSPVARWVDDPKRPETQWSIDVHLVSDDSTDRLHPFARVYGDTKEVASMRAELICIAINRGANL